MQIVGFGAGIDVRGTQDQMYALERVVRAVEDIFGLRGGQCR